MIWRRILQALLVIWITFTVSFLLLAALPSDAVAARYADPVLGLTDEQIATIREAYGADEPMLSRYWSTLTAFLTGNFGYSVATGTSVNELLANAIGPTLELGALALVFAVILATVIAVFANFGPIQGFFRALPPIMISVPAFWLGIVLIQVFSFQLGWVPVIGGNNFQNLILPAITLAIMVAAPLAQVLTRSVAEVLDQPFITAVRSRGAGDWWIFSHNVLRNATLPSLTMVGLTFGELIGGSVVVETVFGRNGIGTLIVDAVTERDTAVLLAAVVLIAVVYTLINLLVDLLYPVFDVRLRSSTAPAEKQKVKESV